MQFSKISVPDWGIHSIFLVLLILRDSDRPGVCQTCCLTCLLRKEVIQPHLPIRLPCYDFTLLTKHTLGTLLPEGLLQLRLVHPTRMV